MRTDVLDVVDAAYKLEGDEESWLRGVLAAATPLLDFANVTTAYSYSTPYADVSAPDLIVGEGIEPQHIRADMEAAWNRDPDTFRRMAECGKLCFTQSEFSRGTELKRAFRERNPGLTDTLVVRGVDATGVGVTLSAGLSTPMVPSPPLRARWTQIAAHLAAAYRLRRRVGHDVFAGAEAVLTPAGKVEHLDVPGDADVPAAARTLADAATAFERAHSKKSRGGDRPLAEWRGMVAARWSLVGVVDADGKRFLVAQQNGAMVRGLDLLAPRERQVVACLARGHTTKVIAYELGLGISTVGVLIHRASKKLGARTRADLLRLAQVPLSAAT